MFVRRVSPRKDEEIFVPSGASGALTGVLDSHNLLAKKLLELQQGLDALKKSQEDQAWKRYKKNYNI